MIPVSAPWRVRRDHPLELSAVDGRIQDPLALATSNTVILKPAEGIPLTALRLAGFLPRSDC